MAKEKTFAPMLAAKTNDYDLLHNIRYPFLGSVKIDGVRGLATDDGLVSRTLTRIPNQHTRELFSMPELKGLDGELVFGNPFDKNVMQQTLSAVMTREGTPDVHWYIFDKFDEPGPYYERAKAAKRLTLLHPNLHWVSHVPIANHAGMMEHEARAIDLGYEGLMIRDPAGPYKWGRSTIKQGWLLKLKRFTDAEAVVLDSLEEMANNNEATIDARGLTKRASHAANKEGKGRLGKLVVRDLATGVEFEIGTGFTAEQRHNLWAGRKYLVGKFVKYKHFPHGVVDKPRHPVFLGFRDARDM